MAGFWRDYRENWIATLALAVVVLIVAAALAAPLITPQDPKVQIGKIIRVLWRNQRCGKRRRNNQHHHRKGQGGNPVFAIVAPESRHHTRLPRLRRGSSTA